MLPDQDQQCFQKPLNQWPQASGLEMRQWLKVHTQHIKVCLEQAKRREAQGAVDIRKWFSPTGGKQLESNISDGQPSEKQESSPRKQRTLTSWLSNGRQQSGSAKQDHNTIQIPERKSKVWYQMTMAMI